MLDFENLDDFFELDDFAQSILKGPSGSEVSMLAIFDSAHFAMDESMAVISSRQPMLACKSIDLSDVVQDTRMVINGVEYAVDDIQPDGTGISVVTLHRV